MPHPHPPHIGSLPLAHRLHGVAVRTLYRILAPRHPRGWVDVHHVITDATGVGWVHTHGMTRLNLPEVEMVDVPPHLAGYCHGILFDVIGYLRHVKPIADGESFGGNLVSEDQVVPHQATMHAVTNDEHHRNVLRVVDQGLQRDGGFPRKLVAAHLLALADQERRPNRQERLSRMAIDIYPGGDETPGSVEEAWRNPNNYFGWDKLAVSLADQGRSDEAAAAWDESAVRWPEAASRFATHVVERMKAGHIPPPEADPSTAYWRDFAIATVQERVAKKRASAGD